MEGLKKTVDVGDSEVVLMAMVINTVESLRGKWVKIILRNLEKSGTVDYRTRKIILDGVNGMVRDLYKNLGLTIDD